MLCECAGQGARAPQKHSAVPEKIARAEKLRSALGIGLLGKPVHVARIASGRRSSFDIPIPGLRASGLDSENYNVLARSRYLDRLMQNLAVAFVISDDVVGWEQP